MATPVARHQGVFEGKFGIMGKRASGPFSMFVIAEENCPSEFRYHSW